MDDRLTVLLHEHGELRHSERAARDTLHKINAFTVTAVSVLLVAILNYKIMVLSLLSPLIFFFIGYLWSLESLRLLRLLRHIAVVEVEIRKSISGPIPPPFESSTSFGGGMLYLLKNHNIMVGASLLYAVFYALFFYLLLTSNYPRGITVPLSILYAVVSGVFWGYDLWLHREYLFPKRDR